MSADEAPVVATWVTSTGCGSRFETLTADGQVHVDGRPPLGEPYFEGEDDPDYNPICWCRRTPKQFCMECAGCAACGHCRGPHVWPPAPTSSPRATSQPLRPPVTGLGGWEPECPDDPVCL